MEKHSPPLRYWALLTLLTVVSNPIWADSDFFKIKNVRPHHKPGKNGAGIWIPQITKEGKKNVFVPCLEATIVTGKPTRSSGLTIKAHFFDEANQFITTVSKPSPALRELNDTNLYDVPVFFAEQRSESVFFGIPKKLEGKKWSAVVVFGDSNEAEAKSYPEGSLFSLNFPGKDFALASPKTIIERKPALSPLIEHVVRTNNPSCPQITLFLRPPDRATDPKEFQGVLALCVLAPNVEVIRRKLQSRDPAELDGLLQFADKQNLAILCWGSQVLWRPDASYDELERETNRDLDRSFDSVAEAWDRGVEQLHAKYGIPQDGYLLWGVCGSAQWAHRLALRKPERFLAAYIHIPSSFDQPTVGGAKVLWLLTTGERDGGYGRAGRWYKDCRDLGYPMIYKPIINLGHAGSPIADNLGMKFFEYALTVRDKRKETDERWAQIQEGRKKGEPALPWLAEFQNPEFFGDYLNQEVFPSEKQEKIPVSLRVPLPNKILAEAWNK